MLKTLLKKHNCFTFPVFPKQTRTTLIYCWSQSKIRKQNRKRIKQFPTVSFQELMKFLPFRTDLPWECPTGDDIKNHFFTFQMCFGKISPSTTLFLCSRTKLPAEEVNNRFISAEHTRVSFCTWAVTHKFSALLFFRIVSKFFQLSLLHLHCAFHVNVCYHWFNYS